MSAVRPLNTTQKPGAREKSYPNHMERFLKMGNNQNVVPMSPEFYRFTGSLGGALFLAQLLYWDPRTKNRGRWIYKTDADWTTELGLTIHAVREARLRLEGMGIIETALRRANGSPTTHYRCDLNRLEELWSHFLNTPPSQWAQELKDFKDQLKVKEKARKAARHRPSS